MKFSKLLVVMILLLTSLFSKAQNNGGTIGSISYVTGKYGYGAEGTGSNNAITIPDFTSLLGSTYSRSTLVNCTTPSNSDPQVITAASGNNTWTAMDSTGALILNGYTGNITNTSDKLNDGTWHRLLLVYGPNTVRVYDGRNLITTVTGSSAPSSGTASLLGFANGSYANTNCIADEDTWFKGDQYAAESSIPTAAYTGSEQNLVALYHLDGNTNDSVGSNNQPAQPVVNTIAPNNSNIYYPAGGWYVSAGYAQTVNPGNYLRLGFTGSTLTLNYDGSGSVTGVYPHIRAIIDGVAQPEQVLTNSSTGTLVLATGLISRKHSVELQFVSVDQGQSRWTNPTAVLKITGFTLDSTASSYALGHRTKLVWIYGDSISEGYNARGNTGNQATAQNAMVSFLNSLRDSLDAEIVTIGFAGGGLVATVGAPQNIPALPTTYNYLWDGQARPTTTSPDAIFIALGQNDYAQSSSSITTNLVQVANALHSLFGNAAIRALTPLSQNTATAITAAQTTINQSWFATISTAGWFNASADSPDGVHPYDYAHKYILAPNLFPLAQSALYPSKSSHSNLFNSN